MTTFPVHILFTFDDKFLSMKIEDSIPTKHKNYTRLLVDDFAYYFVVDDKNKTKLYFTLVFSRSYSKSCV